MNVPRDLLGRPLESLRVSVTDRCNLRCSYCMPEDEYVWLPRPSILRFEEIERVVGVFASLGVSKLRLTGGEPTLRHELPELVAQLAKVPGITDLAMTTNATLLDRFASELRDAGLQRVTVSLDTLQHQRYREMVRADRLDQVLSGIEAVREAGFPGLKINTVVVRGVNDDELIDLVEFGKAHGAETRFIEYMDVGGATRWSSERVVSQQEMLDRLGQHYGAAREVSREDQTAPADRFQLPDGTIFGIVASTTRPFCRSCDRSRLTADGMWYLCLYASDGVDLKGLIRGGASDEEVADVIESTWRSRNDRGAELRSALPQREVLYQVDRLRADPRKEMHTRGG